MCFFQVEVLIAHPIQSIVVEDLLVTTLYFKYFGLAFSIKVVIPVLKLLKGVDHFIIWAVQELITLVIFFNAEG